MCIVTGVHKIYKHTITVTFLPKQYSTHLVLSTVYITTRQPYTADYPGVATWSYFKHVIFLSPSVLWRCWLGGRKGILPVKNWVVGYWCGYLSGARCRLACGPADATATHCLLLHLNPDWFCLLVPVHPGSPGQRAVKRVCVYIYTGTLCANMS